MSNISRRGLFGLGAGAVIAPFIKPEQIVKAGPTVFEATGVWTKPAGLQTVTIVIGEHGWRGGGDLSVAEYY